MSNRNSPHSGLCLLLLVLLLDTFEKSLILFSLCSSIRYLEAAVSPLCCLYCLLRNKTRSPSLLSCRMWSSPKAILVILHGACSSMAMPFLAWVLQNWTQHARYRLRSEHGGETLSSTSWIHSYSPFIPSQMQDPRSHLPLLDFRRFLSDHVPSLFRCLCTAALFS